MREPAPEMSIALFLAVASLLASCASPPPDGAQKMDRRDGENPRETTLTSSALAAEPGGWEDLLARGLEGWKRVALPPGTALSSRDPWRYDPALKAVAASAEGIVEVLLTDREFGDGVFHVEWRFKKVDREGYNSGIYFRTSPDVQIWHQAQVAIRSERPVAGDLFGKTPVKGEPKEVKILSEIPSRALPPGEWNIFELTCRGPKVVLWLNGAVTAVWDGIEVPRGRFGLQAEYFDIEFRKVLFKPLP